MAQITEDYVEYYKITKKSCELEYFGEYNGYVAASFKFRPDNGLISGVRKTINDDIYFGNHCTVEIFLWKDGEYGYTNESIYWTGNTEKNISA